MFRISVEYSVTMDEVQVNVSDFSYVKTVKKLHLTILLVFGITIISQPVTIH